ncbi:MAG: hypothetical protein ACYDIE_05345 [Candidatus Krumholzibacteriia bacterium]
MRGWRVVAAAVAVAWFGLCPAAIGGGSRDLQDGWLLPPDLLRPWLAPGQASGETGAWVAAGQGRLYGMPELPLRALAAGWRAPRWRAALAWQRLGADLLLEERVRGQWLIGARQAAGVAVGWDALRLGDAPPRRQPVVNLELRLAGPAGTRLAGSLPLLPAPDWYGRGGVRRWWSFAAARGDAAWCLALDRDARGAPLLEGEGALRLADRCGVGLRWEPATGTLGLTTAWLWRGLLLRSSHLAHPVLGVTHRWSLGVGRGESWP